MADQDITTSIDDLVKYLTAHGETESSELAKALGVSENIIGKWTDVLEKAKVVKISYKVGKMFISLATTSKGGIELAKKTVEMKKEIAQSDLSAQLNAINQVGERIEEFKKYVTNAEGAYRSKAGSIKSTLDEINSMEAKVNATYEKLREKKDYIDKITETLNKSLLAFDQKARTSSVTGGGDANADALIKDIENKLYDSEALIRSMNKEFDASVENRRKAFAQMVDGVRDESRILKEMLAKRKKENDELSAMEKSHNSETERMKRQVAKEKERILDDISKSSQDVQKVYMGAENEIAAVKKSLADVKSKFGGFADLSDKLKDISAKIDDVEKKKNDVAKGLGELSEQLRAISSLNEVNMTQKSVGVETLGKQVQDSDLKIEKLSREADEIKNDIDGIGK